MTELHDLPLRDRWARLRFAVVGPLLAAPPEPGPVSALATGKLWTPYRDACLADTARHGQ